jgi:serine/threonine protein kinase/thioredoxin-like negative regulator of GroEL
VDIVFRYNDEVYIIVNDHLNKYNKNLKVKYPVVGYQILQFDKNSIKRFGKPIIDCNGLDEAKIVKFLKLVNELNLALFEDENNLYLCKLNKINNIYEVNSYYLLLDNNIYEVNSHNLKNIIKKVNNINKFLTNIKNEEIIRNLVIELGKEGLCKDAINGYKMLSKKYPEEALTVAQCYEREGEELEALKIYSFFDNTKYKQLENKLKEKANSLIKQYETTGNLKYLYQAIEVLPTYDVPFLKLGLVLMERKNYNEALKYLEEAIARNRSYINLISLAKLYLTLNDGQRALQILNNIEKIQRSGVTAYLKGLAYEMLNAPKHAEREFIYSCKEGIIEACNKISIEFLSINSCFSPEFLVNHVIYGYRIEKLLGVGGMGYVYLAEKNGRKYAIKILKKDYSIFEILNEIAKLQEVSRGSEFIVRIFGTFIDENWNGDYYGNPPAIIMEYMSGGSLQDVIMKEEYSSLRHSEKWKLIVALIYRRVIDALIHIHKRGYVHCDIKPSNILLNNSLPKLADEASYLLLYSKCVPKISDLGSAVKVGNKVLHYTPYYAHPLQRFGYDAQYFMDIYSLTVSIYVTLTKNYPLPEWLENEIERAVIDSKIREDALKDFYSYEPKLDYIPYEFKDIITKGLKTSISLEEIKYKLDEIINNNINLAINIEDDKIKSEI